MTRIDSGLGLRLLGPPSAWKGEHTDPLPPGAPLWLLTFLACQEEPALRTELLELLYPGAQESAAHNRLRNLLHRIRQSEWGAGLEGSATHLRWDAQADVRVFRQACRTGHWERALDVYRGPLLSGLRPADLPDISAWLDAERDELETAWLDAALHHALDLEHAGQTQSALIWLERVLERDPYAEEAVQAAIRCALTSRRPEESARVYRRFQARLQGDLGLEPSPATTRLHEAGQREAAHSEVAQTPVPASPPEPSWPAQSRPRRVTTSLFGRQDELGWILAGLEDPQRRLLTLTGPGGAGKTRLSLEAMTLQEGRAPLQMAFVPLEAAASVDEVVFALALALGLTPSPDSPLQRVTAVVQNTPHLLVLDNLEHLLASDQRRRLLTLIATLLDEAPHLRLLVTSRVRLGLQSEWVITLGGLDYPQSAQIEAAARASAVRLFVERAAQIRPGFALSPENLADVIRICQLTGALPLALELTATWMGTFGPADLVAELQSGLSLLEVDSPDRPERHHSLRAAFEHSWRLLRAEEQRALMALSVFRGGFERAAALAVSGSGLRPLLTLADHSLLRRDPSGRFSLHEVIRQFAAEKLQLQPEQERRAAQAHADWYTDLALQAAPLLHGPEQSSWLARLQTEHDNLRLCLEWQLAQGNAPQLLQLTNALHWFWYVRGHHREGLGWLVKATEQDTVPARDVSRAAALSRAGGLARDLGEYARSRQWLQEALALARGAADFRLEAEALHGLGLGEREHGELEAARLLFEEAEGIQRRLDDLWALASTLNDLGIVWALQGDLGQARPYFQESLILKERIGDRQGVAYALANLGNTTDDLGEYQRLTEQSLEIKRELGDRQGMANSLYNLADLHLDHSSLGLARALLSEALELFWQLGRQRGVATTLMAFAKLAAREDDPATCLRLVGAAEALLESMGLPAQDSGVGGYQAEAAERLGGAADEAYRSGRELRTDAAVGLALRSLR